jgi:hypothetical protein
VKLATQQAEIVATISNIKKKCPVLPLRCFYFFFAQRYLCFKVISGFEVIQKLNAPKILLRIEELGPEERNW